MGKLKKTLEYATKALQFVIRVGGGRYATDISIYLSEQLVPVIQKDTSSGVIQFYCQGTLPAYRAVTLLSKEPETIEWINGFDKSDVLWDIGANVGVYSLYAARRGCRVNAFEPTPGNYYLLNKNVHLNGFEHLVQSYCLAFNDQTRLDNLFISDIRLGGSMSTFGQTVDWEGERCQAAFRQSMIGFSIDDFIRQFNPTFPNHIKIDVDGIENKIVNGAFETFSNKSVKSILIELNTELDECAEVVDIMKNHGLKLFKREHAPMFDSSQFSNTYNHIFLRES